jgi:hypothetical protein
MTSNPVLEELWRIKDEIARDTGYNIHTLCQQTRQWAAAHPHTGPIIRNADDLRRLRQGSDQECALRDEPQKKTRQQSE